MAFQIMWVVPQRLIRLELTGDITIEESAEFDQMLIEHLDSGIAPVHVILDFSSVASIPLNPKAIISAQQFMKHPNLGWGMIVGMSRIIRFLSAIIFQAVKVNFLLFESYEEAQAFLCKNDASISLEVSNG